MPAATSGAIRSALAQFVGVAAVLASLVTVPFVGPIYLIIVAVLLLVPTTYPRPAELRGLRSVEGVSRPLMLIATRADHDIGGHQPGWNRPEDPHSARRRTDRRTAVGLWLVSEDRLDHYAHGLRHELLWSTFSM